MATGEASPAPDCRHARTRRQSAEKRRRYFDTNSQRFLHATLGSAETHGESMGPTSESILPNSPLSSGRQPSSCFDLESGYPGCGFGTLLAPDSTITACG